MEDDYLNFEAYDADTTASILPPHDFPEGTEVNPSAWTAIQDDRHVAPPKKTRAKKTKKTENQAATAPATAPTSQGNTTSHQPMEMDRERASATPMPITPQPDAFGAAANALPPIPPAARPLPRLPECATPHAEGWQHSRANVNMPPPENPLHRISGPQRPDHMGGPILFDFASLNDQTRMALGLMNTNYDAFLASHTRGQPALMEMHLRQCISAQEALRELVGDKMTADLSQEWNAKTQLAMFKEMMAKLRRAQQPPPTDQQNRQARQPYPPRNSRNNRRDNEPRENSGGMAGSSSDRGLERILDTAAFLQRASAYMDRRGRSRSNGSNRRRR